MCGRQMIVGFLSVAMTACGQLATVSVARQVCRPTRTSRTGERSLVDPPQSFTSDCFRGAP
jgi:hypothetical protein